MSQDVYCDILSTSLKVFICFFLIHIHDDRLSKSLCVSLFYFGLHWVFVAVCKLSLVAVSRGHSLLRSTGFSLWWLLSLWSRASRQVGSVVVAPRPWHADSAVIVNCSTWSLPRPGIESMSLHWQSDSYPLRRWGSPVYLFLFN